MLVSYINKIALFMVKGIKSFSKALVLKFFELSFSEFEKSSIKDQMYKVNDDIIIYIARVML